MKRQWNVWQRGAATCIVMLALGLVLPQTAAAQADRRAPQPEIDGKGMVIPGHFTVTICRGEIFDMTPRNNRGDIYTTPHGVRVTRTNGRSARGGEHGTNGTIRFTSGAPGVPGPTGETTIEYEIFDMMTGRKVQDVLVRVRVIDCRPADKVEDPPPPVEPPPPVAPPPPPPPPPPLPPRYRTPTHRQTNCPICQDLAVELNAASDKFNLAVQSGLGAAALESLFADVTRLGRELTECEKKCAGFGMRKKVLIGGGALAAAAIIGGSGGGAPVLTPTPAPISSPIPTPAPVTTTPPAPTTPAPAPVPVPATFTVTFPQATFSHPGGPTSVLCMVLGTTPVQPGAAYILETGGPAVLSGQSVVSGLLNQNGQAAPQVGIGNFGTYNSTATVTSTTGVRSTGTITTTVNSSNNTCPRLP